MLTHDQIDGWANGVEVGHSRGPWAQSYTGRRFYPLDPRPEDFCLTDFAHHLSQINRFAGACKFPYSVAQHSLLCYDMAKDMGMGNDTARWGLIHDLPEYMLGDHIRPVKVTLDKLDVIEEMTMDAITQFLGICPAPKFPGEVKYLDHLAASCERVALLPNAEEWRDMPKPNPKYVKWIVGMAWWQVRDRFLDVLKQEFPHAQP